MPIPITPPTLLCGPCDSVNIYEYAFLVAPITWAVHLLDISENISKGLAEWVPPHSSHHASYLG